MKSDVEIVADVIMRKWAALTHCCYFSELSEETQAFWRPIWTHCAEEALNALERNRAPLTD
jgi:hypothetical protein